jgi:septum formation protein
MMQPQRRRVILASGSKSRRALLAAAGVSFDIKPADVDEPAIREAVTSGDDGLDPADVAEVLARAKAEAVSGEEEDALVIGADQILELEGRIFEKPTGMDGARRHLLELRGKTHQLHSAVVIAQAGETVWSFVDTAHLTMRPLTPQVIGDYLAAAGEQVCQSVGAYQLESIGIQLFEKIEGDYFTILGLPMLPLLAALRINGGLPE